jgi:hypothetical protein
MTPTATVLRYCHSSPARSRNSVGCAETLPNRVGVRSANRSDDVVRVVEQVTTRVAMAIGTCDFAITERDRRDLIRPPPSTEL